MKQKLFFLMLVAATGICFSANAKVWRVNNNNGVVAGAGTDFTSADAARADSRVQNGDTLYFECSPTHYGNITLNKRLTLIGSGYFLGGSAGNAGLQANTNAAILDGISMDSLASGSEILGLQFGDIYSANDRAFAADNITISRCGFGVLFSIYYSQAAGVTADGWNVNKCYFDHVAGGANVTNLKLQNNIITGYVDLGNTASSGNIVRNNVLRNAVHVYNGYFANNIISNNDLNFTNTIVKNNLAIGTQSNFTSYVGTNGNQQGFADAQIFKGAAGNSTDGQWQLASGSPATGAGLTVGAVTTPDCGAFGGPDPYRLSGIPPIPAIYSLTVPASIPSGTASMNITFSTRSNN